MRISIFGLGYVGSISAAGLAQLGHTIIGLDIHPGKRDSFGRGIAPVGEPGLAEALAAAWAEGRVQASDDPLWAVGASDLSLVCVGTPALPDGGLDESHLSQVMGQIADALRRKRQRHLIVMRSTVLPRIHTALVEMLSRRGWEVGPEVGYVVHPEFLREGSGLEDFFHPAFLLFGGATGEDRALLDTLYPGFVAPTHYTDRATAALVKYANNLFHSVKVSFANEIGQWSQAGGVDGRLVMSLLAADEKLNLSSAYLRPGLPFGGGCLPKDLSAVLHEAAQNGLNLPLLSGSQLSNRQQLDQIVRRLLALPYHSFLLTGLAFKPGTDDLRESPLVALAQALVDAGRGVRIYAPEIDYPALTGANLAYAQRHLPELARLLIDDWRKVLDDSQALLVGHPPPAPLWAAAQSRGLAIVDLIGKLPPVERNQPYLGLYW